jgi:hypothetical protein
MYIVEFAATAIDALGSSVAAPKYPPLAKQRAISITGSSTQSEPFSGATRFIQYHTDANCSVAIDANPAADPDYDRMGAGDMRFVGVDPGHRLAVIANNT